MLLIGFTLSSCASNSTTMLEDVESPYVEISCVRDQNNNIIERTLYNTEVDKTYVHTYTYEYINGYWKFEDSSIIVYDANEEIVGGDIE